MSAILYTRNEMTKTSNEKDMTLSESKEHLYYQEVYYIIQNSQVDEPRNSYS